MSPSDRRQRARLALRPQEQRPLMIAFLFLTMPSIYAVWSGYELELESFRDFMGTLYGKTMPQEESTSNLMGYYISWKGRLPPKERAHAPKIRCTRSSPPRSPIAYLPFSLLQGVLPAPTQKRLSPTFSSRYAGSLTRLVGNWTTPPTPITTACTKLPRRTKRRSKSGSTASTRNSKESPTLKETRSSSRP